VTLSQHIKETYEWLNKNADLARPFLEQCTKNRIPLCLNVNDPTNVAEEWNWKTADHILLDDYDTRFLQCPRNFIRPFKSFLTAAGAVAIDYGKEVTRTPQKDEDRLSNLSASFERMRRDGVCTDVMFTFESAIEEPLYAHRAYLAACSDYFRHMFLGNFYEAGDASSKNPIIIRLVSDFSRRCLEHVLGRS
jgi:hypothetical protein